MKYYFKNLKPIIILAHCKEPFLEEKNKQLDNLVSSIDKSKYFILLSANSRIPNEIINKCNYYQQDSFNYNKPHYSFAIHLKLNLAIHNLMFHGFKQALCLEYDAPIGCHESIIDKASSYFEQDSDLKFYGHDWKQPNSANQGHWFADLRFLLVEIGLLNFYTSGEKLNGVLGERLFYHMIASKGLEKIKIVSEDEFFLPHVRPQMFQAGGDLMLKEVNPGEFKYTREDGSIFK